MRLDTPDLGEKVARPIRLVGFDNDPAFVLEFDARERCR
jgi:hypothetical protein